MVQTGELGGVSQVTGELGVPGIAAGELGESGMSKVRQLSGVTMGMKGFDLGKHFPDKLLFICSESHLIKHKATSRSHRS